MLPLQQKNQLKPQKAIRRIVERVANLHITQGQQLVWSFTIASIILVLSIFITGNVASASSAYDSLIHVTQPVSLTRSGCSTTNFDLSQVTTHMYAVMIGTEYTESQTAFTAGEWAIFTDKTQNPRVVGISYSTVAGNGIRFNWLNTSYAYLNSETSGNIRTVSFQLNATCDGLVRQTSSSAGNKAVSGPSGTDLTLNYIGLGYNLNPPTGYAGVTPTGSVAPGGIDWTGIYRTTNDTSLTRTDYTCEVNINNWYELVQSSALASAYKTDLATAVGDPSTGSWALSMFYSTKSPGGYSRQGRLTYRTSQTTLTWSNASIGSVASTSARQIVFWIDSSCNITLTGTTSGANIGLSTGDDPTDTMEQYWNVFIAGNVNYNYPSGYNGEEIRTGFTFPGDPTRPSLQVDVAKNDVTLSILRTNITQNPECVVFLDWYTSQGATVTSSLIGTPTSYVWQINLPDGDYLFGVEPATTFVTFPVEVDGFLMNENGCDEELWTSDDFQTILNYSSQVMQFTIDGSYYSLTSDDLVCDNDTGVCTYEELVQDCSAYGLLEIEGFKCVISNMFNSAKSWFVSLFIPDGDRLTASVNRTKNEFSSQLGAISYPITFVNQIKETANDAGDTPACGITTVSDFAGTQTFGFCDVEDGFGTFWDTMILIIRAVVAVGIIVILYNTYKKIINDGAI